MSKIKEEVVNELHKPARKRFKRRHVIVKGLNDLIQADLVELGSISKINQGFKFILTVINVFNKYLFAEPVKRKNALEVTNAMRKILTRMKHPVHNIHTDQGKEFFNREFKQLMEEFKINHYSTFSTTKASVVERVNRTLKNLMWKQFSLQGNYKWINILQDIVTKYNNTPHQTIGLPPSKVNKRNAKKILQTTYSHLKTMDLKSPKFKVGDNVRISKYRELFSKSYTPSWSNEIFSIRKVQNTNPTTYLLKDQRGQAILGGFYTEELQKTSHPDIYLIERIVKRKGDELFVKWLGLDKSYNSWINKNEIV